MPHATVELAAEALPRRHAAIAVDAPAAASRPGDLSIEICASVAGLEALAPAWQGLLDRCGDANPFFTPAWHLAWWRAFGAGKTPHIVALRDGERLAAVMPLLERRERLRGLPVRVLASCDNEHASRTGMVVEPGREAVAAAALARHLAASSARWDVLMLRQLPAHAAWVPRFVSACSAEGLAVFGPTPAAGRCVLPLSGTWEAYLATQSGHFRQRLKELRRRVERQGAVSFRRGSGGPDDFADFLRLEATSWKDGDAQARLGEAGWAFQREIGSMPGAACCNLFLELDGRVVGAVHAIGYAGTLYSFQTLFDESARRLYAGRMQFARHIADAFADARFHTLDLNGNSPFCKSWTASEQDFVSLQVYHRRPYSRLLTSLKRWMGRAR